MMKSLIQNIVVLLVLSGLTLVSCTQEEPDIFSASPAERLNKAIGDYHDVLIDTDNGWEMDYYANTASGGYTLLVKFEKSGNAILATKNELTTQGIYEQDSCLFDIIGDNGPVLTFNTFSKVLHAFSNPENPYGYGLRGDYEFVMEKVNTDTVWLKGKKYGVEVLLRRMPQDIQWKFYADKLYETASFLLSEEAPDLKMRINKVTYNLSGGHRRIFTINRTNDYQNQIDVPFIVTENGIEFHNPIELEGLNFKGFSLNRSRNALISNENPLYKIIGADDLADFIISNDGFIWKISPTGLSDDINQLYQSIRQTANDLYAANDIQIALKYSETLQSIVFSLNIIKDAMQSEGQISIKPNSIGYDICAFLYKDSSNKIRADKKGLQYYNEIPDLDNLLNILSADFELSTDTKFIPLTINCIQKDAQHTFFTIQKEVNQKK